MTTIIAPTDVIFELMLIGFVATFVTVATVWILWSFLEKSEVIDIRSFLTFVVVVVPFVMLILRAGRHNGRCGSDTGRLADGVASGDAARDPGAGSCLYRPNSVAMAALAQT
jgi:hypothetical protein